MKRRFLMVCACATTSAALVVSACGSSDDGDGGDGPSVVASFYPLAYAAERVAGDSANVENITTPGVEAHDLELTGRQVGEIADADLVVYLRDFQPAVDDAVEQNAAGTTLDVAEVADLIDSADEHTDEHEDEHEHEGEDEHDHSDSPTDPHIWLDPTNMIDIGFGIADRLSEINPENAETYQDNAAALESDLLELDEEYRAGLAQCDLNVFVTSHEAFGYLAHRYDLEQVGIGGIDPESEPSPERIAEVQDVVTDEGVTTIFYERLVSPEVAQTLADDLGVEAAVLDPIEGLTDDTADEDYLSLMRANLAALRTANGCS